MKRLIAYPFSVEILVPNIEQKINPKDEIEQITYGPDISRKWLFDEDVEYAEWQLLEGKRLMTKTQVWAKQFAKALNKTADVIESEINVNDLPTIIWNDTEYSVLFSEDGTAEIINEFGNTVLILEDACTIQQVNEQLANQEVVVEEDIEETIDEELDNTNQEIIKESNRILKRLKQASAEVKDIINKAQQYAYIDSFKDEFDATMIDFEHTLENINATEEKIKQDNDCDITQRKEQYYALNKRETRDFQQSICPVCKESSFVILDKSDEEWIVQCNECDTVYNVNPVTGEILIVGDSDE